MSCRLDPKYFGNQFAGQDDSDRERWDAEQEADMERAYNNYLDSVAER